MHCGLDSGPGVDEGRRSRRRTFELTERRTGHCCSEVAAQNCNGTGACCQVIKRIAKSNLIYVRPDKSQGNRPPVTPEETR